MINTRHGTTYRRREGKIHTKVQISKGIYDIQLYVRRLRLGQRIDDFIH
jgi:hypothetical protein